ncbi:FMN-binding negative transcriptional regulator [Planococcus sp. APC 3906]|uniref:FMN-binding negative transcriptional regulator n=1 Tax=Planococcus sp. APC 3906 TaxID=3035194 RepID=UPI0025B3E5B1|nr:FMN-binding negative transcriptional regulator [Planococcus sp. APC 3906]MDN3450390.1 FMN-binding negative transcriptional regulator [Planococcus sp. APC 3906]
MYIPKHFKVADLEEIQKFIHTNSFGTLITTKNGKPIATHLPLQLVKEEDDYFITGHMAYGNPQWRTFDTCGDVLITFQGPHAYISSSWYEKENVPTWNYQAVHLYGAARLLDEAELIADLTKLMQKYEQHREHPVLWETLSSETLEKELKGIVGFKVQVTEVQAASKMSQKRNETDYGNIIDHLKKEEHANSSQVAEAMDRKRK